MSVWDRQSAPAATIAFIKAIETFRAAPYDDGYGYWTIGYGSRRDAQGREVTRATPPVTVAEAEAMLARDLAQAIEWVRQAIRVPLADHQAGALVSLAYNLGSLNAKAESLVALVNAEDWRQAAERFQVYRMSAGKPSLGLRRRRWAEAAIFLGADPVEAQRLAWDGRIRTVDDWPPLPEGAEPVLSEADRLNELQLASLRRGESRRG